MININLLKDLYKINSPSHKEKEMVNFLTNYVSEHYPSVLLEIDDKNNIYITKGQSSTYPVVVAHVDQVTSYTGNVSIFRYKNIILGFDDNHNQVNLGADDKNGVWIALQLLHSEPCIKIVLFTGEEVGCIGSKNCDMDFFDNARFVIQCDRRNSSDFIYSAGGTELCSQDFVPKELMDKYGYKFTTGLMTDVQSLKRQGLKVACCNLSCGYYNPHTSNEVTDVTELINCLHFVREIIRTIKTPVLHEYVKEYNPYYKCQLSFNDYYGFEFY